MSAASCGLKGWGMVCRDALTVGETVLEVPWAAILTEDHAADTYLGQLKGTRAETFMYYVGSLEF